MSVILTFARFRHSVVLCIGVLGSLACGHDAVAASPRELVEVVDISGPVVSPNGRNVAFRIEQASIERNSYDTFWFVQDMEGNGAPSRVGDAGTPLRDSAGVSRPAAATWSPDGRWIYYRALIDGRIDVWRASRDGSGTGPVTRDPADVRGFILSDDGLTCLYRIGATRQDILAAEQVEYDRGIRIHEATPVGQNLFRSGNIEGRLATQRLGSWFNRVPLLADVPDRWKAADTSNGATSELAPSAIPPEPQGVDDLGEVLPGAWKVAYDPVGDRTAVLTRTGDAQGLLQAPDVELVVLVGRNARSPRRCRDQSCTNQEITGIRWRPDSDDVLFTVTDSGQGLAQSIFRWNVVSGEVRLVTRSDGLLGGGRDMFSSCGVSAVALACVAAEADGPPRLERIDLETGDRRVLFDPNAALARKIAQLVQPRLLRWTDAAGHRFSGQFFPASGSGDVPSPLFVTYYHCSGFVRGGLGDEWPLATLAARGISALCINAAPYRLDAIERYGLARSAVESAVDLLAGTEAIDRRKVGMGGLSFGTEATFWTLVHSDLLAAASVSSPGISELYYLLGSLRGSAFFTGLRNYWQAGEPDETPKQWQALSPTRNLDKITAPILMQLPEQEYMHSLDYAIPLIRNHRADVYVFPHAPHQKFQPRHKLSAYERNVDWFRFWLLDEEDPHPAKVGQYAHWRLMRSERPPEPMH